MGTAGQFSGKPSNFALKTITLKNEDFTVPLFVILFLPRFEAFFFVLYIISSMHRKRAASNALKFAFETAPVVLLPNSWNTLYIMPVIACFRGLIFVIIITSYGLE